ncbi:Tellurium resistance protein TerZ [Diplonema papillatum]|nr:Tellurium resistance protein TerZ [Diplonema papillatum]KAJ9450438.1 Tellurium resistance protein TerZ [Diplonema papillatum]KAJ9450439.1 Tellurium resistance protein TerZ [Diplonema papillatum]
MEAFTHEEYVQAARMNGREPSVTEERRVREAEVREKRLAEVRAKLFSVADGGGETREYTHEAFAEVMKMQGKRIPVTPDTIAVQAERDRLARERLAQVKYKKKGDDTTLGRQWEEDHAAEEARAEKAKAANQPPDASEQAAPQCGVGQAQADCPTRNYLVTIGVDPGDGPMHRLVEGLEEKGTFVKRCRSVEEAKNACTSPVTGWRPGRLLCVLVAVAAADGDGPTSKFKALHAYSDARDFIEWVRKEANRAGCARPPVAVFSPAAAAAVATPDLAEAKRAVHQPPYAVCTASSQATLRYLDACHATLTSAEELAILSSLVASAGRARNMTHSVITPGKDYNLQLQSGNEVTRAEVSMHWKGVIDLDLSAILLNAKGGRVGMVYFASLPFGSSVFQHSGDVASAPHGEKESISVRLQAVPDTVACLYFVINSYSGQPFSEVEALDASVRIGDEAGGGELFTQFALAGKGGHRAVILCRVYRTAAAAWGITSVNVKHASADTARGLVPTAQKHYREFPPATWEC